MSLLGQTGGSLPALCVVNYNGRRYLPDSLGRARELKNQFSEIVVVDDASTDDSIAVARSVFPEARILPLPENRGPGAGRNAAFEVTQARRILFIDNDVYLNAEVAPQLFAALDSTPNAVMAMPRVVSARDPEVIEYDGGEAHFSGLVTLRGAGGSTHSATDRSVKEVGSLITSCFMLDRARWNAGAPFDEEIGIYGDDHELGLRARIRGRDLVVVPKAVCLHGDGTPGLSIRESGEYSPVRIRNTILNRWQVLLKLYETRTLVLMMPYLAAFELFQLAGCVALGWSRPWALAGRALFGLLPDLRARRRVIQRMRQRPDAVVLSGGPHPFNPRLTGRPLVKATLPWLDALAMANWSIVRLLSRNPRSATNVTVA